MPIKYNKAMKKVDYKSGILCLLYVNIKYKSWPGLLHNCKKEGGGSIAWPPLQIYTVQDYRFRHLAGS